VSLGFAGRRKSGSTSLWHDEKIIKAIHRGMNRRLNVIDGIKHKNKVLALNEQARSLTYSCKIKPAFIEQLLLFENFANDLS